MINTVQQALGRQLTLQGVYDAVGETLCKVFPDADALFIRRFDAANGLVHFPFWWSSSTGVRHDQPPIAASGFAAEVLRTRKTLVVNRNLRDEVTRLGSHLLAVSDDRWPKSQLVVPMLLGGEVVGMIDINNVEREDAFGASDVRLLETVASASQQIAQGHHDLSERTEIQASSLQQTTASMGELSSKVRYTADQSALACRLSDEATAATRSATS